MWEQPKCFWQILRLWIMPRHYQICLLTAFSELSFSLGRSHSPRAVLSESQAFVIPKDPVVCCPLVGTCEYCGSLEEDGFCPSYATGKIFIIQSTAGTLCLHWTRRKHYLIKISSKNESIVMKRKTPYITAKLVHYGFISQNLYN